MGQEEAKKRQKRCEECRKTVTDSKLYWKKRFCSDKCRNRSFRKKVSEVYKVWKKETEEN